MKLILAIAFICMFGFGFMCGIFFFLGAKVKGEIVFDREHYSTTATIFKFYDAPDNVYKYKYVLFRLSEQDLRDKFGEDLKL